MWKNLFILLALLTAGVGSASGQTTGSDRSDLSASAPLSPITAPTPSEPEGAGAEVISEVETTQSSRRFWQRLWFRGEYLLWGIKDSSYPALLTTGPSSDPKPGSLDS